MCDTLYIASAKPGTSDEALLSQFAHLDASFAGQGEMVAALFNTGTRLSWFLVEVKTYSTLSKMYLAKAAGENGDSFKLPSSHLDERPPNPLSQEVNALPSTLWAQLFTVQ